MNQDSDAMYRAEAEKLRNMAIGNPERLNFLCHQQPDIARMII